MLMQFEWDTCISFIIPLSKVLTFSAPVHLRACSFIRPNLITLSSERILLSGQTVTLLSERRLSTFVFAFCNERQFFTTFENSVYFLSSPAFRISNTSTQYMSIRFNFSDFLYLQQLKLVLHCNFSFSYDMR